MSRRLRNLAWDGIDALRAFLDLVRWPFERLAWLVERRAIWPLRERAAKAKLPSSPAVVAAVGLLVAGGVAFGLTREGESDTTVATAPVVSTEATNVVDTSLEPAEPVLRGAKPDFTPDAADVSEPAKSGVGDGEATETDSGDTPVSSEATEPAPAATSSAVKTAEVKDPGPAAIEVARRFSSAFVLYETGRGDAEVRTAFGETASPQLARALLQRPPRLPANVKVPKAKVLNVVPGPRLGDTFTLSASLLRVGVTSELRIDVQRDETTKEWRVTDVLG
jgi:hypothetical protein